MRSERGFALLHLADLLGGVDVNGPAASHRNNGGKRIDRKSTRLNSSHTVIYTLSLHDALPIYALRARLRTPPPRGPARRRGCERARCQPSQQWREAHRSEEHTSELQSHSDLHSFPTRRSSDLCAPSAASHSSTSRTCSAAWM